MTTWSASRKSEETWNLLLDFACGDVDLLVRVLRRLQPAPNLTDVARAIAWERNAEATKAGHFSITKP